MSWSVILMTLSNPNSEYLSIPCGPLATAPSTANVRHDTVTYPTFLPIEVSNSNYSTVPNCTAKKSLLARSFNPLTLGHGHTL